MIGILGGMGTQAGLDFCNKLAMLNRGKIDQEYPLFILYNKSNIPGRPESIGIHTKAFSVLPRNAKNISKYNSKYIFSFLSINQLHPNIYSLLCEHLSSWEDYHLKARLHQENVSIMLRVGH